MTRATTVRGMVSWQSLLRRPAWIDVVRIPLVMMTVVYGVGVVVALPSVLTTSLDNGIHVLAAVLVALRAVCVRSQRFAWSMMAMGIGFYAAGSTYAWLAGVLGTALAFPSLADFFFLLVFPFTYVAIIALIHGHGEYMRGQTSLDGLIAGLGAAALFSSVVMGLFIAGGDDKGLAEAVALAFPVGDALLVGTLLGVFAVGGWTGRRNLGLLTVAMTIFAVADTAYVAIESHNAYQDGGIVSLLYLTALTLVGVCAWRKVNAAAGAPVHRLSASIGLPTVSALSSLTLILVATRLAVPLIGVLLAGLALLAVVARALVLFREINTMALYDRLTGLPNRALIIDRLDQLLARSRRQGTTGAALFIDLDGFKEINDALGHEVGDSLLRAVAQRLTVAVREADTFGRLGGDEFIVLVGGSRTMTPEVVAARLLDTLCQPFTLHGAPKPVLVTASIGIAVGDRLAAADLLRDADLALYRAKAGGKDRFALYSDELQVEVDGDFALEHDLGCALEREQFRLVYQPIYNLNDLSLFSVEALLRWHHPVRGIVQPDDFIPRLEADGRIVDVGRWVLLESCRQMKLWHDRGSELSVSVNVSGRQLDRESVVDHVAEALAASGLDPTRLMLEITETALTKDPAMSSARLLALKGLGVRVAVDDFGTGYSSLAYLQQFPVDCLKIDRVFTDAITRSPEADAMIHALVQLGKDLGLTVVAEGVEASGQLDCLRVEAVDGIQGFLLSRPLTAEVFEETVLCTETQRRTAFSAV